MSNITKTITLEVLAPLGFEEGDHVQGVVNGAGLELRVTQPPDDSHAGGRRREKALEWIDRWAGAFANPDVDLSKDDRLEYLLNK